MLKHFKINEEKKKDPFPIKGLSQNSGDKPNTTMWNNFVPSV